MEWTNKYNSFNSWKGLTYYDNYKKIIEWMDGGNYLPPPIECNLDPIARCNLNCYFCIGQRYLKHNRKEVTLEELPDDYIYNLVKFLSKWGVRGLCVSGGGEPSLKSDINGVLDYAYVLGMDTSFVTNAVYMPELLKESLMYCRWVALSVDAGDKESYERIKGGDAFDRVIHNIVELSTLRYKNNAKVDLCYKMLLLPENQHTIYSACKLAKDIGVQDFHVRPVDFERPDIRGNKKLNLDKDLIEEQFEKCHELETDDFHVYTVTHKFDENFHVKHDFTKCLATPLVIPILTDGNAYVCVDHKMKKDYKLGSCYPDPENILSWWGSDLHRDIIRTIKIEQCPRCTWSQYNQQISEIVEEDRMCLSFP